MKHLLQHFKTLTKHPQNASELKGLILQLAIQGKLTENWRQENPDVEPASKLLERIKEEKKDLIAQKKIKKGKVLSPIEDDEKPYDIPENWVCCRLGEAVTYGTKFKAEKTKVENDTWVLELEDVEKSTSKLLKKVRFNDRQFKSTKSIFQKGDVIYGKLRPYLDKVIVADEKGVCTTEMIPINSHAGCMPQYLRIYLKNPNFISYANDSTHGMNLPRMGTDKAINAIYSLPPLEEQKVIVEIVDQLFEEVEQLEDLTKTSIQLKEDFVASALQRLSQTENINQEWQFLQSHFTEFFTEKSTIKQLRETLLQLAVQGKLTANWRATTYSSLGGGAAGGGGIEHASELLKRIQAEKQQLIAQKKIKKEKALPPIEEHEKPYDLPEGWVWCRLGDFGDIYGGSTPSKAKSEYWNGDIPWVSAKDMKSIKITKTELGITEKGQVENRNRIVPINSILMVTRSGILKRHFPVSLNEIECTVNQDLKVLTPVFDYLGEYIRLMLHGNEQIILKKLVKGGMTVQSIEFDKFLATPFPYPPLEEQKAIVKQVNSLMALCDSLEEHIENSQTQIEQLMQSCLREVFEDKNTFISA